MLTLQQRKQLRDALASAFPERSRLEQLLYFGFEKKNLNEITRNSYLQEVIFKLIQTAESQGWLLELVCVAYKENPGNSQLQAIAQELLSPSLSLDTEKRDSTQTASFQNEYCEEYCEWLIPKYQHYRTEGFSQIGSLSLSNVFVPLKVAASYKDKARPEIIPLSNYEINSQTIWDFLVAAAGETPKLSQRCIVMLGAPGAGKTTLLRHLSFIYASKVQKKYYQETSDFKSADEKQKENYQKAQDLIPILLLIREVYQEIVNKQPCLADLIAEQAKWIIEENQNFQPLSKWFSGKLNQGRCLVMLDGLDEVADERERKLVRNWVDQQVERYHKNIFILTSRPRGYRDASLNNAGIVLEVQPFKLDQVRSFIHKWYLETKKIIRPADDDSEIEKQAQQQAEDLINRIINSSSLAAMAVNPLLLTMISTVHHKLSLEKRSLPEKRVDLYKEMCEVLLEKRQEDKGIPDTLQVQDKQFVLQVLALNLMQQTTTEFKLTDGTSWVRKPLATVVNNEVKPEKFIEFIRDVSGLLVEKELNFYQFPHLSFQEYLAAVQVSELKQEDLLIANINESWWAETIRLYAAQNDATTLIRAVLDMKSPSVDMMALAYDCLEECLRVDDFVRLELTQRLEDGLESTDPEIFKLAVQVSVIRRFKHFVWISEKLQIDNSDITCAQYQLFLDETGESRQPEHWQSNRFQSGDAKKTITGISWENALRFCAWIGEWYRTKTGNSLSEMAVHYRLPEKEEINQYFINDDRQFTESGICLIKFELPSRYSKLAYYLWNREWQKADAETASVMIQVSKKENGGQLNVKDIENFPCDDLRIIDKLWVYASKGHFGFSVQKNIYQSLGGTSEYNEKVWKDFGERVGWRVMGSWILDELTFDTKSPKGHLPVGLPPLFWIFVRGCLKSF